MSELPSEGIEKPLFRDEARAVAVAMAALPLVGLLAFPDSLVRLFKSKFGIWSCLTWSSGNHGNMRPVDKAIEM